MHQKRYIQNRPQAPLSTTQTSKDGDGMNIKTDSVHEAMLKEILKKWRMKPEDWQNEKIQEDYALVNKKKR